MVHTVGYALIQLNLVFLNPKPQTANMMLALPVTASCHTSTTRLMLAILWPSRTQFRGDDDDDDDDDAFSWLIP